MSDHGFLRSVGATVGDLLAARDPSLPGLVHTHPEETVRDAIHILREYGVSQLPVVKHEPPVVLGEVVGSVTERALLERIMTDPSSLDRPVAEALSPPLPTIGVGEPVNEAVAELETAAALLVLDRGHPVGVVTRTDVLAYVGAGTR
jgi:cystathionine beta-synthase